MKVVMRNQIQFLIFWIHDLQITVNTTLGVENTVANQMKMRELLISISTCDFQLLWSVTQSNVLFQNLLKNKISFLFITLLFSNSNKTGGAFALVYFASNGYRNDWSEIQKFFQSKECCRLRPCWKISSRKLQKEVSLNKDKLTKNNCIFRFLALSWNICSLCNNQRTLIGRLSYREKNVNYYLDGRNKSKIQGEMWIGR